MVGYKIFLCDIFASKDKKHRKMELKNFNFDLATKEIREDGVCHIKAYALAFGNIDSYRDIIVPTACDEFLKSEMADRMALCYQHDIHSVIGKITDKGVDEKGMWIEADILPTTLGKDVILLIKARAIREFSIGYTADKWSYDEEKEVRYLERITIYEVSPVTIASNPKAVLESAKGDKTIESKEEPQEKDEPQEKALDTMSDEELDDLASRVEQEQARRFFGNL